MDRRDFGDVVVMRNEFYSDDKTGREKYIRKKSRHKETDIQKFDANKVRDWVRSNNAEISRKIAARRLTAYM